MLELERRVRIEEPADLHKMAIALQNAIDITDDILSKLDDFAKLAPAPSPAAADASAQPTGQAGATKKASKKKDKKAKKETSAPPAAENEQSSDPFAMADLRVSARFGSGPSLPLHVPASNTTSVSAARTRFSTYIQSTLITVVCCIVYVLYTWLEAHVQHRGTQHLHTLLPELR